MGWRQLVAWKEYADLEPFGDTRADLRMGILASLTANIHTKKGARQFTPADFMPKFGPREPAKQMDADGWKTFKRVVSRGSDEQ